MRVDDVRTCLGSRFDVHYAIKANPHPAILRTISKLGVGADVASVGELEAALEAGFDPENIEFSGPGKRREEISLAVEKGIASINVESLGELEILAKISSSATTRARVGLRVNPGKRAGTSGLRMAGDTQFGIPKEQTLEAIAFLKSHMGSLDFTGLHVHTRSQVLDADTIASDIKAVLDLARKLECKSGLKVRKINFGGGWGINYFPKQAPVDLNRLRQRVVEILNAPEARAFCEGLRMIVEPGRFLVAEAGVYATRVLYRKRGLTKDFAIVDGGMHHNYLLAGGMGQVVRRNFELAILPMANRPSCPAFHLDVAGPLCTPQDICAADIECSTAVEPGDYIVFFNCGAYGPTASPVNFLSHPLPAEVFVS